MKSVHVDLYLPTDKLPSYHVLSAETWYGIKMRVPCCTSANEPSKLHEAENQATNQFSLFF